MSEAPWLTDPKYGGMSEESARRSYEAWVRQGCKPLPKGPAQALPASDEEIARNLAACQDLLADYERTSLSYVEWMRGWWARRPKGFRAVRRAKQ